MPVWIPGGGGSSSSSRYSTSELVEETLGHLSGHTTNMGQVTWLSAALDDSATQFRVAEPGQVSRGIAEIDDELVYVATSSNGLCTVLPRGRGWGSSTPAAHEEGALVTFGPRFPRHVILQTINDVIENIWPNLYGVGETTFTFHPTVLTFPLPALAENILAVEWDPVGPQDTWVPIDHYKFNRNAASADFPTGRSIDLGDRLTPGRTVRVRYMVRPTAIELEQSFEDSGLATSAWPAVMYGALHRLAASLTLGQLGVASPGANELSRVRPLNAVEVSQQYYALHVQFLEQERSRLQAENPIRISYGR
jgi:hypothetical protein